MESKTFTVINPGNVVVSGNAVYFYVSGTSQTEQATIYGTNVQSNPLTQPLLTNSEGQVSCYIPNGVYDVKLIQTSGNSDLISNVSWFDLANTNIPIETAVNEGTGIGLYDKTVGNALNFKSLVAGSNVSIIDNENGNVTISSSGGGGGGGGTVTGAETVGTGYPVFDSGASSSTTLAFKTIVAGPHVSIADDGGGNLTISASTSTGTVTSGESEGSGNAIFDSVNSSASTLVFKSIAAGSNISITGAGGNTLTINSTSSGGGNDYTRTPLTITPSVFNNSGTIVITWSINITSVEALTDYFAVELGSVSTGLGSAYVFNIDVNVTDIPTDNDPLYMVFNNNWYTNTSDYPGATKFNIVFTPGSSASSIDTSFSVDQNSHFFTGFIGSSTNESYFSEQLLLPGTVTSASNEGSGYSVYDQTNSTSTNLAFKTLTGGSNVTITDDGDGNLTFASSSATLNPLTFNPQTSNYTLVLSDISLTNPVMVQMNSSAALNLTVPPHSAVAAGSGIPVYVTQVGTGQVTLVAGSGVTLLNASSLTLRAQNSTVALIQTQTTNTWLVVGDVT